MIRKRTVSLGLAAATACAVATAAPAADYPALGPLPPVRAPADNPMTPAKVELGKKLFFDGRLSGNGAMPCAACHRPDLGWGTGGAISFGYPGTTHWRNSQTILNSAYYSKLFWDGSSPSLEAQAWGAAGGAVAGNGDDAMMEMRLAFAPEYKKAFKEAFGAEWPAVERCVEGHRRLRAHDRLRPQKGSLRPLHDGRQGGHLGRRQAGADIVRREGRLHLVPQRPAALGRQIPQAGRSRTERVQGGSHSADHPPLGVLPEGSPGENLPRRRERSRPLLYDHAPRRHREVPHALAPLGLGDAEIKDLLAFLDTLSMDEPLVVADPDLPPTAPLDKGERP